jgi:hypothetical protein
MFLFLLMMFSVQFPFQASALKTNFQVEYINNRLTVNVDNVALGAVLAAIREKTGIEFVLSQELSEVPISIQLGPLSVVEGLKRMLSHSNHAFIYGSRNKLIKVVILSYSKWGSSPRPREVTETPSAQRVISPLPAEVRNTEPTVKDGRVAAFSSELKNINQPAGEDIISTPSLRTKGGKLPSVKDMIVRLPTETITVKPTSVSVEDMMIPTPPDVIASKVRNMIVGESTKQSKSKGR